MSLETVSGATLLLLAIIIPVIIFGLAMIAYSVKYWLEKRKEEKTDEHGFTVIHDDGNLHVKVRYVGPYDEYDQVIDDAYGEDEEE